MTAAEISVVIPACAAEQTLRRAVASAIESDGLLAEAIVVANDDADYERVLRLSRDEARRVRFVRTPTPRSGPSSARNLGMAHADAPLLAFLDADDFYAPDRLARLAPLALERGAATGPCVPVTEAPDVETTFRQKSGVEPGAVCALSQETILSSRRSFSPVLRRELASPWRPIGFAEDMIFNIELQARAPDYAYVPDALYGYVQTAQSGSRGPGSLERAIRGYGDILSILFELNLEPPARAKLFRQLRRDLDDAGAALFERDAAGWGEALGGAETRK